MPPVMGRSRWGAMTAAAMLVMAFVASSCSSGKHSQGRGVVRPAEAEVTTTIPEAAPEEVPATPAPEAETAAPPDASGIAGASGSSQSGTGGRVLRGGSPFLAETARFPTGGPFVVPNPNPNPVGIFPAPGAPPIAPIANPNKLGQPLAFLVKEQQGA